MTRLSFCRFLFLLAFPWQAPSVLAADGAVAPERMESRPWWCPVTEAFGLVPQACRRGPPAALPEMPDEDESAWKFALPPPDPEPEPAPPSAPPPFPAVVIEKKTVAEKEAAAPPPPAPAPKIELPPPLPEPDRVREAAEAFYVLRSARPSAWPGIRAPEWPQPETAPTPMTAPASLPLPSRPKALPGYSAPARTSGLPVDNERILTTDRYVSGILETSINSQLAGDGEGQDVVIQVNRDVFGYHGRSILIPKGSRLVCGFRAPKAGETRLGLSCARVLLGGSRAEIWQASGGGHDVQGRPGVTGEVDNRFWEKYGTAFVLAGISGAVRAASAAIPNERGGADIAGEGAQELGERFGEITAAVLEETVNLAPIVTLPQGTRLVLKPGRDWHIRTPGEPLPVLEGDEENEKG